MKKILYAVFAFAIQFANAQTTTISLLEYKDFHAHLTPHKDIIRHGDSCATDNSATYTIGERGGIAKLKTLVTQLRTANPNSILMNIGDTYHGGVEAAYTSGNAIVAPVNALGIDVGVPGNWDFAYGPGVWRKRYTPTGPFPQLLTVMLPSYTIDAVTYPNIAANLTYHKLGPLDTSPNNGQVLPPTMEITKGGIKIGFIGLTSDIVPDMYAQLATGFNFVTGEINYKNLIEQYADSLHNHGCKLVCVMSELGLQKNYRLSQILAVGAVDIIFSAHTHEFTFNPLQYTSTAPIVVEAGNDAWLGKMDVTFDAIGNVTGKQWSMISIDSSLANDASMLTLVNTARAPFLIANPNLTDPMGTSAQTLTRPITDTVGYTNGLLARTNALESTFNDALCEIMKNKAGTQLAITPGFRFDSPIAPPAFQYEDASYADGSITEEDVYRFYPVFYTMATADIKGDSLKQILENLFTKVFSQTAFNQVGGWVDGFAGVDANINLSNADNARVLQMYYAGTTNPINNNDTLTVVGCVRPIENANVLCSHTGFFNKTDLINTTTTQPYTAIQLLEEYLATDTIPTVTTHHFTDASTTVNQWFQSPWEQPVYNANCVTLTTGINQISAEHFGINVFPNPTDNILTIQINSTTENFTVEVFNTLGEKVFNSTNNKSIDVSSFSQGMYFINVQQGNKKLIAKFMKQ
jgi:2',3'-cyclic-nucleotide 2'-phosphodiesterase (5'-nucleotidase family)